MFVSKITDFDKLSIILIFKSLVFGELTIVHDSHLWNSVIKG